MLLQMCSAFGLCILNSSCKGDLHGRYTYVTGLGCSVIDCFIASEELYYTLLPSSELTVAERIESSHFPVEFKITARNRDNVGITKHNKEKYFKRIAWKSEKRDLFLQAMQSAYVQGQISYAISLIDTNVNMALKTFNKCITEAAHCMKTKIYVGKEKNARSWFDYECIIPRRNVRKLLCKFQKSLSTNNHESYSQSRREYKNMLSIKRSSTKINNCLSC